MAYARLIVRNCDRLEISFRINGKVIWKELFFKFKMAIDNCLGEKDRFSVLINVVIYCLDTQMNLKQQLSEK